MSRRRWPFQNTYATAITVRNERVKCAYALDTHLGLRVEPECCKLTGKVRRRIESNCRSGSHLDYLRRTRVHTNINDDDDDDDNNTWYAVPLPPVGYLNDVLITHTEIAVHVTTAQRRIIIGVTKMADVDADADGFSKSARSIRNIKPTQRTAVFVPRRTRTFRYRRKRGLLFVSRQTRPRQEITPFPRRTRITRPFAVNIFFTIYTTPQLLVFRTVLLVFLLNRKIRGIVNFIMTFFVLL